MVERGRCRHDAAPEGLGSFRGSAVPRQDVSLCFRKMVQAAPWLLAFGASRVLSHGAAICGEDYAVSTFYISSGRHPFGAGHGKAVRIDARGLALLVQSTEVGV